MIGRGFELEKRDGDEDGDEDDDEGDRGRRNRITDHDWNTKK